MKICQKETDELNMHGKLKGNYNNLCLYVFALRSVKSATIGIAALSQLLNVTVRHSSCTADIWIISND
jgi:hypothetical protein